MDFFRVLFKPKHWSTLHFTMAGSILSGVFYNCFVIWLVVFCVKGIITELHKNAVKAHVEIAASQVNNLAEMVKQGQIERNRGEEEVLLLN